MLEEMQRVRYYQRRCSVWTSLLLVLFISTFSVTALYTEEPNTGRLSMEHQEESQTCKPEPVVEAIFTRLAFKLRRWS